MFPCNTFAVPSNKFLSPYRNNLMAQKDQKRKSVMRECKTTAWERNSGLSKCLRGRK